jgi:hypothetical protein
VSTTGPVLLKVLRDRKDIDAPRVGLVLWRDKMLGLSSHPGDWIDVSKSTAPTFAVSSLVMQIGVGHFTRTDSRLVWRFVGSR